MKENGKKIDGLQMPRKKKENPKPAHRPQKPIDWEVVDRLLIAGCLGTEIAPHFDMHPDTFYIRFEQDKGMGFTEYSRQKRSIGDSILREVQFKKAKDGDNTLLIWLGKNRLKQAESPTELNVNDTTLSQFTELMAQLDSLQSARKMADTNSNADAKSNWVTDVCMA